MNISHIIRFVTGAWMAAGWAISVPADEQRQREPSQPPKQSKTTAAAKIDLNTADFETLAAVPVIGQDGARAIIVGRPFTTLNDLNRIIGISAERLEQIRSVVTVATLHVPKKLGSPTTETEARAPSTDAEGAQPKVNLNTADLETLDSVPGVSPETAKAIIAARPFTTLNDLNRIKGLSAERLEQIRANTTVTAPAGHIKKPLGEPGLPTDPR